MTACEFVETSTPAHLLFCVFSSEAKRGDGLMIWSFWGPGAGGGGGVVRGGYPTGGGGGCLRNSGAGRVLEDPPLPPWGRVIQKWLVQRRRNHFPGFACGSGWALGW